MSTLYTGSAAVLNEFLREKTPLTALVYASHHVPDGQKKSAYALLMGTLRYKALLEDVLENSNFMSLDRKMNRSLVLLMLYDLLLSDSKSITGGGVVKKLLMQHANHMRTTFVRLKISRGAQSDEDLLPREIRFTSKLPRYVRINTLRATEAQVHAAFKADGFELAADPYDHARHSWSSPHSAGGAASVSAAGKSKLYYVDQHIPSLLVFAPGTDLHEHPLLSQGRIILQDKASCMPAAALDPANPAHKLDFDEDEPWHVLDGCAAPGNKTTHLLAIALEHLRKKKLPASAAAASAAAASTPAASAEQPSKGGSQSNSKKKKEHGPRRRGPAAALDEDEFDTSLPRSNGRPQPTGKQVSFKLGAAASGKLPQFKLEAFEVDPARFQLLHKMMARALPSPFSSSVPSPLPPTTGGDNNCPPCPPAEVTLHNRSFLDVDPLDPRYRTVRAILLDPTCSGSGMMHRIEMYYKHKVQENEQRAGKKPNAPVSKTPDETTAVKAEVIENVEALAAFQKEIVQHALRFPNLQLLCYSTCSVHAAEDECVVSDCLASIPGRAFSLSPALPSWFRRGAPHDSGLTEKQAALTVRVAGAEDGMNGFFVARFKRTDPKTAADRGGNIAITSTAASVNKKGAAVKPVASATATATTATTSSQKKIAGKKHPRDEETKQPEESDDEEDEQIPAANGVTTTNASATARKNKKKREKAKLKKQKLAEAST